MASETVLDNENEQNRHVTTRHFDVGQSEEDDEDHQISLSSSISTDDHHSPITNKVESFDDESLNKLYDDWLALDAELRIFEPKHKEYVSKLDDVESLKSKQRTEYDKYKKKLDQLQKDIGYLKKSYSKKGIGSFSIRSSIKVNRQIRITTRARRVVFYPDFFPDTAKPYFRERGGRKHIV
jgi:hypothetical protein